MLQYISSQERRFHTFVANRVAEVREKTEVEQRHHVSTKDNPADDASRGVAAGSLGLPQSEIASTLSHEDPEMKSQGAVAFAIQTQPGSELVEKLIVSYSHWIRLVRTVACFKSLARQDESSRSELRVGALQLQQAEDSLIIHVQEQYYPDELSALREGRGVPPSSPLYKLGPSLVKGITVATGRLANASLPSRAKEPPIISHEHPIAEKIVRFAHEKTAHSGREYVVAELRRKYWITRVRGLVKGVLKKCMTCRGQDARPYEQQMGDLPPDRVTPGGLEFASVGVDYFSPIAVKRGREQERINGDSKREKRGDLVLITDKQLPRNEWSTGRVVNVVEGQDGLVRTAEVRTHAGTFLRPVVKLCVLEENAFGQQQSVDDVAPLKK